MSSAPRGALLAAALALSAGCGTSYQPSRTVDFQLDREAEIDDEDIRKAFDARPQMPKTSIKIAYYTLDPEIVSDLEETMMALPGVSKVYRIPPLLVTGQRRLNEGDIGFNYGPPREISVKKLRLLAARSGSDVFILVDHGYRNIGANPLVAFAPFILPLLFVPFLDTVVKGYVEAFVIDVKNGFLYGQIQRNDERGDPYATIYAKGSAQLAKEQWAELRAGLQSDLLQLFESERNRTPVAAPALAPALDTPPPPPPAALPPTKPL